MDGNQPSFDKDPTTTQFKFMWLALHGGSMELTLQL